MAHTPAFFFSNENKFVWGKMKNFVV